MADMLWPNRLPIPDGIVPMKEIPQDPAFLDDDDEDDSNMEMED